jgi:hypothetical protein
MLHAGDLVYPAGEAEHHDQQVFTPFKDAMAGACLFPAPGDHDLLTATGQPFLDAFSTFANNPERSELSYSFDVAHAHVLVLDSNRTIDDYRAGAPLGDWLRVDLTGSGACWKLVVMHRELYGSSTDASSPEVQALRAELAPVFQATGVDVVFSGHVHAYERTYPIADGMPDQVGQEPAFNDPAGPVYVVTGGGGRPLHDDVDGGPLTAVALDADDGAFHFVWVRLADGLLTLEARAWNRAATDLPLDAMTITKVCGVDLDGDTLTDDMDNCPLAANALQEDLDTDGTGDACDRCPNDALDDVDGDLACGDVDNCPVTRNATQADADGDALPGIGGGDACDPCPLDAGNDADADGHCADVDNCPAEANAGQEDADADGAGDACDACPIDPANDADADGRCADADNCPAVANPTQDDRDADTVGDDCDACSDDPSNDVDVDGICGAADNCPSVANAGQEDADTDGAGDACDTCPADATNDADSDGVCGAADNCPAAANPTQDDTDMDGAGDACDVCPADPADDADSDGACADADNCPAVANPSQDDLDADGLGDACDTDADGDLVDAPADCDDLAADVNAVPPEAEGLLVAKPPVSPAGMLRLTWADVTASGSGTRAQLLDGDLSLLHLERGFVSAQCVQTSLSGTSADIALPSGSRYFLLRAVNACGRGTWGDSTATSDPRDALDVPGTTPCP